MVIALHLPSEGWKLEGKETSLHIVSLSRCITGIGEPLRKLTKCWRLPCDVLAFHGWYWAGINNASSFMLLKPGFSFMLIKPGFSFMLIKPGFSCMLIKPGFSTGDVGCLWAACDFTLGVYQERYIGSDTIKIIFSLKSAVHLSAGNIVDTQNRGNDGLSVVITLLNSSRRVELSCTSHRSFVIMFLRKMSACFVFLIVETTKTACTNLRRKNETRK